MAAATSLHFSAFSRSEDAELIGSIQSLFGNAVATLTAATGLIDHRHPARDEGIKGFFRKETRVSSGCGPSPIFQNTSAPGADCTGTDFPKTSMWESAYLEALM